MVRFQQCKYLAWPCRANLLVFAQSRHLRHPHPSSGGNELIEPVKYNLQAKEAHDTTTHADEGRSSNEQEDTIPKSVIPESLEKCAARTSERLCKTFENKLEAALGPMVEEREIAGAGAFLEHGARPEGHAN